MFFLLSSVPYDASASQRNTSVPVQTPCTLSIIFSRREVNLGINSTLSKWIHPASNMYTTSLDQPS